jgi:putative peptide modification system cyclase
MDGMLHESDIPQLRTLLLTDLCDSTQLVEGLGDGAAATLFRDHDRLVLELQQRWRGRLIDRSDGLLLLFERPLDGLGFALDYRRSLDALGQAHRTGPLLARAGLHVGEVLIWRNSEEAVSAGAKQVEVEGLAKPFAARLMQLARPGQILLSSVAEPLVRRASRELGERGDALQWRTHGRWQFKGVPEVQEIHEVGEPDLAPLRAPRGDAKARRDMPVWRRPVALVAEAVLVAGVAVGVWFMTRPEPAIAFSERDWVVVGDLRNLTGQTVLDDSLEQAFRISLEQSRYVNVLSDLKMDQTLKQMRLDPETAVIDRSTASQVAVRDGARAVLLPTVNVVDNQVQFSVEVVDPVTQGTVYSERASGKGLSSVLDSIDEVTSRLRGGLGEAVASISQSSTPLPQATTSDLDALRAYALAEAAMAKLKLDEARLLFESAIRIDPAFARAHLGLASIAWARSEQQSALRHVQDAALSRDKLMARDQLMIDAWQAEVSPGGNSLPQWVAIATLFPDNFSAHSNASWHLLLQNRFAEALLHAKAATVPQAPRRAYTLIYAARSQTALGHPGEALKALDESAASGPLPSVGTRAEALLLLGRRSEAYELLSKVKPEGGKTMWLLAQRTLATMALEEGDIERAIRISEMVRAEAADLPNPLPRHFRLAHTVLLSAAGKAVPVQDMKGLEHEFRVALSDREQIARHEDMFRLATLIYVAQRNGNVQLAADWLDWLSPRAEELDNPLVAKMLAVASANQMRLEGRLQEGIAILAPQLDGSELLQARVVMRDLSIASDSPEQAGLQDEWLKAQRGRALSEAALAQVLQPLNLVATSGTEPSDSVAGGH